MLIDIQPFETEREPTGVPLPTEQRKQNFSTHNTAEWAANEKLLAYFIADHLYFLLQIMHTSASCTPPAHLEAFPPKSPVIFDLYAEFRSNLRLFYFSAVCFAIDFIGFGFISASSQHRL